MYFQANISIHQAHEPRWDIVNFPDTARRMHLSYHDHSHYASVNSSKPSTSTEASLGIAPEKEEGPTKEESLIMQSTSIDDLGLIRRTMETFNYDIDAVYDYLFSLKEMEQSITSSEPSSLEQPDTSVKEEPGSIPEEKSTKYVESTRLV